MRKLILSAFFLLAILSSYPLFSQEIYHWTDENGVDHYTDDLGQVPDQYRPKHLESAQMPSGKKVKEEPTQTQPSQTQNIQQEVPEQYPQTPNPQNQPTNDENYWRGRIAQSKKKLEESQKALDQAYETKRKIYEMFYPGSHEKLANVNADIDRLKKEIEENKYELEVKIPEEARQQGVPAGWLR